MFFLHKKTQDKYYRESKLICKQVMLFGWVIYQGPQFLTTSMPPRKSGNSLKSGASAGVGDKFNASFQKERPICCSCQDTLDLEDNKKKCSHSERPMHNLCFNHQAKSKSCFSRDPEFQLCGHDGGTCNKCPYLKCDHNDFLVTCGECYPPCARHGPKVNILKCMKDVSLSFVFILN